MDANIPNLISKNIYDHTCMAPNTDDAIECAPRFYCRILVGTKY